MCAALKQELIDQERTKKRLVFYEKGTDLQRARDALSRLNSESNWLAALLLEGLKTVYNLWYRVQLYRVTSNRVLPFFIFNSNENVFAV